MGTILEGTIDAETQHPLERSAGWSIPAGARDLELTAHALRVLLLSGRVAAYTDCARDHVVS